MYPSQPPPEDDVSSFHSTRWTLVLAAGDDEAATQQSLSALSELCRIIGDRFIFFCAGRAMPRPTPRI